jgi:hypothetical protein
MGVQTQLTHVVENSRSRTQLGLFTDEYTWKYVLFFFRRKSLTTLSMGCPTFGYPCVSTSLCTVLNSDRAAILSELTRHLMH